MSGGTATRLGRNLAIELAFTGAISVPRLDSDAVPNCLVHTTVQIGGITCRIDPDAIGDTTLLDDHHAEVREILAALRRDADVLGRRLRAGLRVVGGGVTVASLAPAATRIASAEEILAALLTWPTIISVAGMLLMLFARQVSARFPLRFLLSAATRFGLIGMTVRGFDLRRHFARGVAEEETMQPVASRPRRT